MQGRYILSNLLTFSHTQQPITTIVYTHKKMGVNENLQKKCIIYEILEKMQ